MTGKNKCSGFEWCREQKNCIIKINKNFNRTCFRQHTSSHTCMMVHLWLRGLQIQNKKLVSRKTKKQREICVMMLPCIVIYVLSWLETRQFTLRMAIKKSSYFALVSSFFNMLFIYECNLHLNWCVFHFPLTRILSHGFQKRRLNLFGCKINRISVEKESEWERFIKGKTWWKFEQKIFIFAENNFRLYSEMTSRKRWHGQQL